MSSRPATSGSDGSFRVAEALYGHTYRLTAQAAGYAPSALDLPPLEPGLPVDPVHIVLSKGRRVLGSVVDSDGNPVAEAEASLLWPLDPSEFRSGLEAPARTATSDPDGRFRLRGFSSVLADLGVEASGYPALVERNVRVDHADPVLIELRAGASIAGRVLDNGGNGAAGVPVYLWFELDYSSDVDPRLWDAVDTLPEQVTDRDGRFRFDGLAAGTWSAEASRGPEGAKLDGIELMPGGERGIELVLRTRDRLIVTVVTEVGEPVADAQIDVEAPKERFPTGYGQTDGSGRAVIDITPDTVTVTVSHETLRDESRQVRLEPGDNEVRFELRRGLELSGTVRSYRGTPLPLATVAAETDYSSDMEWHSTNTVSDRNGAFRLTGLESRPYILTARAPGYADGGPEEPVEIRDDAVEGIEIVLEPEASIVAAATGLSPSDLDQVRVSAWKGPRVRDATRDTEGKFSVQGVGPGTLQVEATKGDWERTVERTVTIERGTAEVFVELPFERGLRLSGQVVEDGAPLGGAILSVGDVYGRADREGRFALEGLMPGPNQVVIRRPDFSGTQYQSIDLQTDLEGVRIQMVTHDGYEDAQIPLNIAPGEYLEGLVIRLQPTPPDAPDQ